jgi:hypothetical protein
VISSITRGAAEDALLEYDLWKWLVVAADRAEDMEAYRALDLNHDDQRHDDRSFLTNNSPSPQEVLVNTPPYRCELPA